MLQEMSVHEFEDWIAFSELEPWDERRDDYRTASVVAAIVNMQRDTKKYPKPVPIEQFLLPFDHESRKPKVLSPQEQLAQFLTALDQCGVT